MSTPRSRAAAITALAAAVALPATTSAASGTVFVKASFPAATAAVPGGGLEYGELQTGRIWKVDAKGKRSKKPLATIPVSSEGLNGMLGLAVDSAGRTFAAFTTPSRRLMVEQVAPGKPRVVYDAGRAGGEANGARLAFRADGKLLVTVGDRDRSVKETAGGDFTFPDFPNWSGYVAVLDPAKANKKPTKLATGWFNPYGLAVTPSGAVWVTDNAIDGPEHLARADEGSKPTHVADLPHSAPSGLAAIDETRLAVCGFVSQRLDLYTVGATGVPSRTKTLAKGCTVGVIRLADGRLAYSTEKDIRVIAP